MRMATPDFVKAIMFFDGTQVGSKKPDGTTVIAPNNNHLTAIQDTIDDPLFDNGGTLLFESGQYLLPAGIDATNRRDTTTTKPLALIGAGSPLRGTWLRASSTTVNDTMLDLTGSSHFHIENIFFQGNPPNEPVASFNHIIRMARFIPAMGEPPSAGRHRLIDCILSRARRSALVSVGSEFLYARTCDFQGAPIGVAMSAYPEKSGVSDADYTTHDTGEPFQWTGHQSNGGVTFVNCTLGDPTDTTRAGAWFIKCPKIRLSGCIYQTVASAECKVILDEIQVGVILNGWADLAGNVAASPVFKIGKYSPNYGTANNKEQNRLYFYGNAFDVKADNDVLIDASNMKGTILDGIWANRVSKILLDNTCVNTRISNALYGAAVNAKVDIVDTGIATWIDWGNEIPRAISKKVDPGPQTYDPGVPKVFATLDATQAGQWIVSNAYLPASPNSDLVQRIKGELDSGTNIVLLENRSIVTDASLTLQEFFNKVWGVGAAVEQNDGLMVRKLVVEAENVGGASFSANMGPAKIRALGLLRGRGLV